MWSFGFGRELCYWRFQRTGLELCFIANIQVDFSAQLVTFIKWPWHCFNQSRYIISKCNYNVCSLCSKKTMEPDCQSWWEKRIDAQGLDISVSSRRSQSGSLKVKKYRNLMFICCRCRFIFILVHSANPQMFCFCVSFKSFSSCCVQQTLWILWILYYYLLVD